MNDTSGEHARKRQLAEGIADYVATANSYDAWDKRRVAMETVAVLTDDIGAAQQFCAAIGLDVDLYQGERPSENTGRVPFDEVAKVIQSYLVTAPEQGDWPWEDHCDGLAGGIIVAIRAAGMQVVPVSTSGGSGT